MPASTSIITTMILMRVLPASPRLTGAASWRRNSAALSWSLKARATWLKSSLAPADQVCSLPVCSSDRMRSPTA